MPYRRDQFSNGNYYHIFNKTIDHKEPFLDFGLCVRFLEAATFYRSSDMQVSLSRLKTLPQSRRNLLEQYLKQEINFKIDIIAYCLMPNHFHLVLNQRHDNGIEEFISNLMNSFTRFYNTLNKRKGPLFLTRFHSVSISSKEQLLNVARYVHLNPKASGVVTTFDELREYPWSSYRDYIRDDASNLTQLNILLKLFKNDKTLLQQHVEQDLDREQTLRYVREAEYAQAVLNRSTTSEVTSEVV